MCLELYKNRLADVDSNTFGDGVFSEKELKKWLLKMRIVNMIIACGLVIHLQKAAQLSKEWGEFKL